MQGNWVKRAAAPVINSGNFLVHGCALIRHAFLIQDAEAVSSKDAVKWATTIVSMAVGQCTISSLIVWCEPIETKLEEHVSVGDVGLRELSDSKGVG
jgi:hypothetical protein